MDFLERVAGQVEMLFRPDYIHLFTVIERLANERYILQTKKGQIPSIDLFWAPQCKLRLPVECPLPKHRSKQAAIGEERFDIVQDLNFGLGGRANDDDV